MKHKCSCCGNRAQLKYGLCWTCWVCRELDKNAVKDIPDKLAQGLFEMIEWQQEVIDELVKAVGDDTIKERIEYRRNLFNKCTRSAVSDRFIQWKERL